MTASAAPIRSISRVSASRPLSHHVCDRLRLRSEIDAPLRLLRPHPLEESDPFEASASVDASASWIGVAGNHDHESVLGHDAAQTADPFRKRREASARDGSGALLKGIAEADCSRARAAHHRNRCGRARKPRPTDPLVYESVRSSDCKAPAGPICPYTHGEKSSSGAACAARPKYQRRESARVA